MKTAGVVGLSLREAAPIPPVRGDLVAGLVEAGKPAPGSTGSTSLGRRSSSRFCRIQDSEPVVELWPTGTAGDPGYIVHIRRRSSSYGETRASFLQRRCAARMPLLHS